MTQGLSVGQGFVRSRVVAAVSLAAAALGVLVAGGASRASTLTIIPDASSYTVGDTITLDIHGAVPSDCVFCDYPPLFAELTIAAMGSVTALSTSQNAISYWGEFVPLIGDPLSVPETGHFPLSSLNLANLEVVNQYIGCSGPDYSCYYTAPNPLATATFTATSPGQVTFGFNAATFNFFDAAPTSTATIEILPIPEPGTATLVGMGLVSLSVCGRRHRRVG